MKQPTSTLLFLTAVALLVGCTSSYAGALDQKLAGKSPEQRRTVLAQECAREIRTGLNRDNPSNVRHFQNLKRICEEMTGKRINAL